MAEREERPESVVELADWLLTPVPGWPQPVDPFEGLPRPERATCDNDWVL